MAIRDSLGCDLALTRFLAADEWGDQDLHPEPSGRAGIVAEGAPAAIDLLTLDGRANLAQALVMRLLSPRGTLRALGHANWGSRLYQLVGRRKDATTRQLARLYVLEAVHEEPRVEEVVALTFPEPAEERPDTLGFTLHVRPVGGGDPLALDVEVSL